MMDNIIIIISTVLCGILYRMGGSKNYNTLYRDIGVSGVVCIALGLIFGWNWWLISCFGLMWGALSTYNSWIKKPYFQWFVTGLSYGISILPYSIDKGITKESLIRSLILALLISWLRLWNKPIWKWSSDVVVEVGNGLLIGITLYLL